MKFRTLLKRKHPGPRKTISWDVRPAFHSVSRQRSGSWNEPKIFRRRHFKHQQKTNHSSHSMNDWMGSRQYAIKNERSICIKIVHRLEGPQNSDPKPNKQNNEKPQHWKNFAKYYDYVQEDINLTLYYRKYPNKAFCEEHSCTKYWCPPRSDNCWL